MSDAEGGISGIFSERDIVRGLVEYGTDYLDMPLGRAMSSSVITCTPDNSVEDVMELMTANGIRHLPVVDAETLVASSASSTWCAPCWCAPSSIARCIK